MQSVRTFFRLALRFCCGQQPEHARPQQLATLPPPVLLLTAAGAVASSRLNASRCWHSDKEAA